MTKIEPAPASNDAQIALKWLCKEKITALMKVD